MSHWVSHSSNSIGCSGPLVSTACHLSRIILEGLAFRSSGRRWLVYLNRVIHAIIFLLQLARIDQFSMASKTLLLIPALATAALGNVLDLDIKVRNGYVCEV